jgi:hypothetical protein
MGTWTIFLGFLLFGGLIGIANQLGRIARALEERNSLQNRQAQA